MGKQNKIEQKT